MILNKRIRTLVASEVVEYVMYENHYMSGTHEQTFSIAKRNHKEDKLIEWLVKSVRKDTAEMVWRDRVDDATWVHGYKRR